MDKKSQRKRRRCSEINYAVSISGSPSSDLAERISALHLSSILKAALANGNDSLEETKQIDTKLG